LDAFKTTGTFTPLRVDNTTARPRYCPRRSTPVQLLGLLSERGCFSATIPALVIINAQRSNYFRIFKSRKTKKYCSHFIRDFTHKMCVNKTVCKEYSEYTKGSAYIPNRSFATGIARDPWADFLI
jgi:hypothetical protein